MPQPILKLIAIAVSLGWLGLILELVRRGRLREGAVMSVHAIPRDARFE